MLLVCRFAVPPAAAGDFATRAHRVLGLLTAAPGCLGGELGRAVEADDRWVLVVRFESVHAYRTALAPVEVRTHVVPLLAEALTDHPATFEILASASAGAVDTRPSLLAERPGGAR